MIFQALSWHARDEDDGHGPHLISIVGKDADGKSVCVTTEFKPYFFVRLPETFTQRDVKILLDEIRERCPDCLEGHGIVRKKDVMGFTNNEERLFLKLDARNLASRRAMDGFFRYRKKHLTVYESNIEPTLRLMHRTGIQSVGWLEVGQYNPAFYATTDVDVFCDDWRELKPVEGREEEVAPFVVASFDIEAYSERKQFPDANLPGDACYQIAMTLCKYGESEPFDRVCFCHKETADVPEGRIEWFDTEREVLEAWAKYVHDKNVDVITGYNIFGFDFSFLFTRAVMAKCAQSFYNLGRIRNTPSNIVFKNLSSSALGDNTLKLLPMPGRFIFDLFHLIKSSFKLDSYKLDSVAHHFLKGQGKYDMPAKEMFRRYEVGDPKELGDVAAYCIQDTLLLHLLMAKLATLQSLWEMARACHVSLSHLVERGQQVKVFSQLTRKARELGYMVPVIRQDRSSPDDGYQGATVLDPIPGAYFTPIVALDFASLYPSIMCAHNMCYSTLVLDDRRYGNIPGVEYDTFVVDGKTYKFAQGVSSLLPVILTELKAYRKKAKKEMAATTDPFKKSILDGRQLAYKVSMNSVYGFTGTVRGMLPCVAIASSVTCRGRGMIEETKAYCEKHFNAKVRYGDSVTPDTPLIIRKGGVVQTCRIDSLVNEYTMRDDGKEIAHIDAEVWTENGFTQIEQIVRHKTHKNIHRVLTHTGVVDVTEDHSLLLCDKSIIKPSDVSIGVELLHSDCVTAFDYEYDCGITVEEAMVMGFFFGDGSCGEYKCTSGVKHTWALNNSNMDYLEEMKKYCPFPTKIYDTIQSSGVYKLNAMGNVKEIAERYRQLFYNEYNEKIVPSVILNAPIDIVASFVDGYYKADGDKDGGCCCIRMDIKGKQGSLGMYILGRRLGFKVSINSRVDKPCIFRQTWSLDPQRKSPTAVKKIELLGETYDHVYDLTTKSHHFHVGPGDLVVHNTDSVFVEFDLEGRDPMSKEALDFAWSLGEKAAEQCSALFRPPNDLELEKVYRPLILYSKKRYAAKLWTMHKDGEMHMDYVDVKGLQLKRRDGTKHMRRVCTELLDVVLDSSDTKRPTELAKERALELIEGKIGIDELTLSQSLAAEYKNPNLSHVVVRDKMKARAPGSEPQPGDRVPYVFIKTPDPRAKAYEKAEDPLWVQSHADEIKIDFYHYFTNKFVEPVSQLLQPLIGDGCKQILFGELIKRFKPLRQKKQIKGQTTLDALFKNYAKITSKTKDHGVLDEDCGDAQGGGEQPDSVPP